MALSEDIWSVETPTKIFFPQRQKTETEITMKIEYSNEPKIEAFIKNIFRFQNIAVKITNDVKIQEFLKKLSSQYSEKKQIKQSLLSQQQTNQRQEGNSLKSIMINCIRGFEKIKTLKQDKKIIEYIKLHNIQFNTHE
jgi:hypothetical protein